MGNALTIDFHGDTLFVAKDERGIFVAVTPICQSLGVDAKKQRERIQRDPILSEGGAVVALPSPGGPQETFCLRLDLINGWLFTIDESRVRADARERVLSYKRECYAVLFRHFHPETAAVTPAGPQLAVERSEGEAVRLFNAATRAWDTPALRALWVKLKLPTVSEMFANQRQLDLFKGEWSRHGSGGQP